MQRFRSITQILTRKKNLNEARQLETKLDRCLTVWHLIFYGIAFTVGAGVYVLSGTVVKNYSGPSGSISFFICGIACVFSGLCYVEFASLIPRTGSAYVFTYVTLGEFPAFVVGWSLILDILVTTASVAKAFSSTVDSLTGYAIKNYTINHVAKFPKSEVLDDTFDFVAFGLILLLVVVTAAGAKFSLSINMGLTIIQVACLIIITTCCFVYGSIDNWSPENGGFFSYGFNGMLVASSIAIFSFSGFESMTAAAEEAKNPRRDLPIALLTALGIVIVLYTLTTLGLSYLVNYKNVDTNSPFVSGFEAVGQKWAVILSAIGSLLATGATKITDLYVIPRLFYAIAADGLIFKQFHYVESRTQVPLVGLFVGGLVASILALFIRLTTLADVMTMAILVSYLFAGVDLIYLRYIFFYRTNSYDDLVLSFNDGSQGKSVPKIRQFGQFFIKKYPIFESHAAVSFSIATFVTLSFMLGVFVYYVTKYLTWWSWLVVALLMLLLFINGLVLSIYEPVQVCDMYQSPLLPVAPCVSIAINAILLCGLQPLTWARFGVWLFIGLLVYIFYGINHSRAKPIENGGYLNLEETQKSGNDKELTTYNEKDHLVNSDTQRLAKQ